MAIKNQSKKLYATMLLIVLLIITQLFAPIFAPRAQAIFGIADFGTVYVAGSNPLDTFVITNTTGIGLTSMDTFKKYVLDLAARIIAGTLIRGLTNQVIGWIQAGGGQNVGFVGNLDQAFRQQVDIAGGQFLNQLIGIDLCTANLRAFLTISLQTPSLSQRLGCTLSGIGVNAERFFQDFQQGGWPAFVKIGLEPQNNPYGSYLIALDSKIAFEDAAGRRVSLGAQIGQGFMGFRVPRETNCHRVSDEDYATIKGLGPLTDQKLRDSGTETEVSDTSEAGSGGELCDITYDTKTPGKLVADTLSKTANIGYDFAVVADEINEAIAAIVNALINKMISESYTLFSSTGDSTSGGGIFTSDLSSLSSKPSDLGSYALIQQVDNVLFSADAALATVNQSLIATQQSLFATRKEISDIMFQISELQKKDPAGVDPAIQTQIQKLQARLSPLRATEADLETKLTTQLGQQAGLLASVSEITGIERAFLTAASADELATLANQLQGAVARVSQISQGLEAVPTPAVATGDSKRDATTGIKETEANVQNEIALYQQILGEIDRQITATSTPQTRKDMLVAKRKETTDEIVRMNTDLNALLDIDRRLAAALDETAIQAIRVDAVNEIAASAQELKTANATMTAIEPILKP